MVGKKDSEDFVRYLSQTAFRFSSNFQIIGDFFRVQSKQKVVSPLNVENLKGA